jgi:hypothetical protein
VLATQAVRESSRVLETMSKEIRLLGMVLSYSCDGEDRDEEQAVASSTGGSMERSSVAEPTLATRRKGVMSALTGAE